MSKFNIARHFFDSAKKYPNNTAIIYRNSTVTFAELEELVLQTSEYFHAKGIRRGDRVMLFVPMSIDLYRIVLGLFNIGAVAVFLDEWVSKERMEQCCKVADCKAFIGTFKARVLGFVSKDIRKIPIKIGLRLPKNMPKKYFAAEEIHESDTALITFTTGSTGVPKAAKRTHGFLNEQFKVLIEKIKPKPGDIDMPVLPIVLLINLGAGCTSVLADYKASKPNSMDAGNIIYKIIAHKVSRIVASPFFVKKLALECIDRQYAELPLKYIFTGGAPVFPPEAALYQRAFPSAKIEIVYGSTEAEPISSVSANELVNARAQILKTGLLVGKPNRNAEVKIIEITDEAVTCKNNDELNKLVLKDNALGEIIVSGPHVLREYWNNDEALKRNKIFIDDKCWHRTGDSGYFDKDGNLFLTGRCNTLIYKGGEIIAPFIYENYFQTIDGVDIGTVLNKHDRFVAVLETGKNAVKDKIISQINQIDIKFDEIIFIKKIPRDPRHNSKIEYSLLKKML